MAKTLKALVIDHYQLTDEEKSLKIKGISADSRKIKPGFMFAALDGTVVDGARFVDSAIANGAVCILASVDADIDVPDKVVVLRDDNPRRALAKIVGRYYGAQPDCITAVTGTNGKSSVVAFVRQIWERMGLRAASMGTIGVEWPGGFKKLAHTTPDPVQIHKRLRKLARKSVTHLAVEASSHGLSQYRLDGINICAGAFTNLSRDHLDYHKDFDNYFEAKMRLFDELLRPGLPAVINMDSEHADAVLEHVERRGLVAFKVGKKGEQIKLIENQPMGLGQLLTIETGFGRHKVFLPLVGEFQASNALVAAGIVIASGGSPDVAIKSLEDIKGAKGRLELVAETSSGATIFVDYAHTPDALKIAMQALRPFVKSRLVVVFGAGGDRDPGKRALMGKMVSELADIAYVTDDNPRTEDAGAIRAQIMAGCPQAIETGDRAAAIDQAVASLQKGDVLLVAGKGHEQGQIIGEKSIPFSDHEAVSAAIREQAA